MLHIRENDFWQASITFSSSLPPQGTSSGGRWKNDFRQAKITVSSLLPPQGTSSAKRWKKTIVGKRKSLFQSLPLPRHQLWKKRKKRFSVNKNHLFQGVAFPSTNFADTPRRMTFSKPKSPFQILAPSNHQLWKNKHQTIFRIQKSFSHSIFIPIIDFFKPKASKSGHICWAHM